MHQIGTHKQHMMILYRFRDHAFLHHLSMHYPLRYNPPDRVAFHQYPLLLSVTALRGGLPMPPCQTVSGTPSTFTSDRLATFHRRNVQPNNPPAKKLWG